MYDRESASPPPPVTKHSDSLLLGWQMECPHLSQNVKQEVCQITKKSHGESTSSWVCAGEKNKGYLDQSEYIIEKCS